MAVSNKVWRFLAFGLLTVMLGFVAGCGDDDGAVPGPPGVTTGSITGRVVDAAGTPITGAQVGTNPATAFTLTDASGNFRIDNVPATSVTIIAQKAGFGDGFKQVVVAAGTTPTNAGDIVLTPSGGPTDSTGTLSGLVSRSNGQPLPGAEVRILRDASSCADTTSTPAATATTDVGGGFLIQDLPAGTYLACVTATVGGQTFTGRAGFVINAGELSSVNITVGRDLDQTTEPNIGGDFIDLDENGNFAGTIRFVDIDGDGDDDEDCNIIFTQHLWVVEVLDSAGNLVSGVRVEWSLNQAGGGVIVTDPTGAQIFVRGTTGVIVDTDDPFLDPVQAESAKTVGAVTPQFKVDNTHAVTYTNDSDQVVDFNGENVTVGVGRTWIIVTSPIEGFTDVVAFSPDLVRSSECVTSVDDSSCPDKDFAIKRWVNWRIEIAELTATDQTVDSEAVGSRRPGLQGLPPEAFILDGNLVADGDTITNRLDRTPQFAGDDCSDAPHGTRCDLSNRAFIGIVLSRLRQDSPFTFITGNVEFAITDDVPDADLDDIDSDSIPGVEPGFGLGGPISIDENIGSADFSMNSEVTFECEFDQDNAGECLDIDVLTTALNSNGQSLDSLGFTITPGSEDEAAAVAVTVSLDSLVFFADADSFSNVGFSFNEDLQALIDGRADNVNAFVITIRDEFGEVCEQIEIGKRWVTSVLQIFKQGPTTVELGDVFEYTVTVVNDGDTQSNDVIMADTLPILDDPDGIPGDRDGNQAFRYVTDDPTFDPDAIRYYVDTADDEGGTEADLCIVAPEPGFPLEFDTPESVVACNNNFVTFPTIAEARAAAEASSALGNQIVIVEYFDQDILARTDPGGDIEAEDSFEITVEAIHSVNEFGPPIPEREEENGEWCNIATVTSAENDFAADSVCTRVVLALLEVRKTVDDAIVPAGDQVEFLVELANNGSEPDSNVTVSDTLDPNLEFVMIEQLCAGCTVDPATPDSATRILTFTVPELPVTDVNGNGIFDDGEGFVVANIVARTPLLEGTFCNRVTASDPDGRSDTDIACVITQVEIEFDIVNADGEIVGGAFSDTETFQVGDTVAYVTSVTNVSGDTITPGATATNVTVLWEIAPNTGILELIQPTEPPDLIDPDTITCSTTTDTCTVTVASLAPGESIALNYRTVATFQGNDVNRITLTANELSLPVENEEPTTVSP